MSQQELLKQVVAALKAAGIDYMVTGSIASSLQGEPRASHDIDLVVAIAAGDVAGLMQSFQPPDYYLSEEAVRDALRNRSMFNLLRIADGEKVDFWILTDEPFDRSRFSRKRAETAFGLSLSVSSPEDTILAKIRWARLSGGSEKQFTDALRVFELQGTAIDQDYLNRWAHALGVDDLLTRIRSEAAPVRREDGESR